MHGNIGYITKVIANYRYKGLGHNVMGPTGVNLFMSCSLLDTLMCFCELLLCIMVTYVIMIIVVIECHFER